MPGPRKYLAEYFSFTRKERTGIITVLLLILLLIFLPFLFPYFIPKKKYDHSQFEKEIAALKIKQPDSSTGRYGNTDDNNYQPYYQPSDHKYYSKEPKGELFYFDPNTLPVEGWKKLGIREKTANTIQNYISKGGRFNKAEEVGKIWGLHEDEVKRLLPYVRIEKKKEEKYTSPANTAIAKTADKPVHTKTLVDINTADTSALIALPGIGSKLANRIIAFRDKLGGFYSIDQVAETYALPDSTFQKIKDRLVISNTAVKQLNINTATMEELKTHPYIRYSIANAVVQYRNQHGNFASVSDLKNILIITGELYSKIEHYVTIR
ncbi:MAG TPA: helix-hairpin-helix domain-containing protein [Ferruginibacter sp.]|nr:helix-hairpin-helix domain-containing protein [Ferruginibacter sp.]